MSLTVTEAARLLRRQFGRKVHEGRLTRSWYEEQAAVYGVSARYVRWRVSQARTYMRKNRRALPVRLVDVAEVARLYQDERRGQFELAALLGVSQVTIAAALFQAKDEGLLKDLRRKNALTDWNLRQVAALAAKGHSAVAIADLLGCSRTAVARHLGGMRRYKQRARKVA